MRLRLYRHTTSAPVPGAVETPHDSGRNWVGRGGDGVVSSHVVRSSSRLTSHDRSVRRLFASGSLKKLTDGSVMSQRTRFLSRLIGLYCIVVSLYMVTRQANDCRDSNRVRSRSSALFAVGLTTVTIGLAMILSHNIWSGGPLPTVVTLVGWVALMKGLLCLFLSPEAATECLLGWGRYEQLFYLYASISLLLGLYLTYGGFRSRTH